MVNFYALEARIAKRMRVGRVPGLALAVVGGGQVIYARGFGLACVETGLPVTPETLFRIGSITKGMTATAVMRLVEAGQLDLDRPVEEYVPWLRFTDPAAAGQITLRRLLSHSAGLPTAHTPFGRRDPAALEAHVRDEVSTYPLLAPPGKLYAYSNPGVRVAGYVAQIVSGRPYTALMQDLVFDPLEMGRTTFDPTVAMTYPLAQSHDVDDDGTWRVQHRFADDAGSYPSGSVISTVLDLAHYALMLMNGGCFCGRQILSPASVAEMQAAQVDMYTLRDAAYGLGLQIDRYKGLRRVSHNGSISTFGSRLAMIPEAGAAAIVLVNRAPGFWDHLEHIADDVLDQVLDLPAGPDPLPPPAEPQRAAWPCFTGSYVGAWSGLATVRVDRDELVLDWNGARVPLSAHNTTTYFGCQAGTEKLVSVGFVPEEGRPARYILVNSSPCERFEPDAAFVPEPAAWAACAGTYYLMGIDRLRVRLAGGRLLVHSEDQGREFPCVTLGPARFACDYGLLEFQSGEDGRVVAVKLGNVYTLARVKELELTSVQDRTGESP